MGKICDLTDGIRIYINSGDHNPPHFHVYNKDYEALIRISDFEIIAGDLPNKIYNEVVDWASKNQSAIMKNWELAKQNKPVFMISP
ncbi:MAG: DUF4160 domain-containing protein [Leptospiraceae bacterium]|jgi:hypothetical protein|nr:DUF4160 domain-containing protein [Leptospiraceae bacterium]